MTLGVYYIIHILLLYIIHILLLLYLIIYYTIILLYTILYYTLLSFCSIFLLLSFPPNPLLSFSLSSHPLLFPIYLILFYTLPSSLQSFPSNHSSYLPNIPFLLFLCPLIPRIPVGIWISLFIYSSDLSSVPSSYPHPSFLPSSSDNSDPAQTNGVDG